jgi:osmotically-inducible protein OsmY
MRGIHRLGWCGLLLTLLASGCSKDDTERLARLSHKIAAKAECLGASTTGSLRSGWQGFRGQQKGIDARVSMRLRWDKELADTSIQVEGKGGAVTLKGEVANLSQRQRAVALAESTTGVERVVDELTTPEG